MPDVVSRSPDGRYVVEAEPAPTRTSRGVWPPVVRDLEGGVVASLEGTLWSADRAVWHEGGLALTLHKHPNGRPTLTAHLDLEGATATVRGRTVPASDLGAALDEALVPFHDRPLAALLRDTLAALGSGPAALGLEAEIRSLLRDLERGHRRLEDARSLFLPTGELQDLATERGWGDRFLELADRADGVGSVDPYAVAAEPHTPRAGPRTPVAGPTGHPPRKHPPRKHPPRRASHVAAWVYVVPVATVGAVGLAAWLGGRWVAAGVGALVAAVLLPAAVAFAGFVLNPVGTLLRGPRTLPSRLRSGDSLAWAVVVGEVVVFAVAAAAFARGCG